MTEDEIEFLQNWRRLSIVEQNGIRKALELFKSEVFKDKTLDILKRMTRGELNRKQGFEKIDRMWRRKDWSLPQCAGRG